LPTPSVENLSEKNLSRIVIYDLTPNKFLDGQALSIVHGGNSRIKGLNPSSVARPA